MAKKTETPPERRLEVREILETYHSVEISVDGMAPFYVFKLRDISPSGMGILVRENSDLLNQIEPGQVVSTRYNPARSSSSPAILGTVIRHISKDTDPPYKGHVLVGLSTLSQSD